MKEGKYLFHKYRQIGDCHYSFQCLNSSNMYHPFRLHCPNCGQASYTLYFLRSKTHPPNPFLHGTTPSLLPQLRSFSKTWQLALSQRPLFRRQTYLFQNVNRLNQQTLHLPVWLLITLIYRMLHLTSFMIRAIKVLVHLLHYTIADQKRNRVCKSLFLHFP